MIESQGPRDHGTREERKQMNNEARKAAGACAVSDMSPVQSVRYAPGPQPITTNHKSLPFGPCFSVPGPLAPWSLWSLLFCSLVPRSLGPFGPCFSVPWSLVPLVPLVPAFLFLGPSFPWSLPGPPATGLRRWGGLVPVFHPPPPCLRHPPPHSFWPPPPMPFCETVKL